MTKTFNYAITFDPGTPFPERRKLVKDAEKKVQKLYSAVTTLWFLVIRCYLGLH